MLQGIAISATKYLSRDFKRVLNIVARFMAPTAEKCCSAAGGTAMRPAPRTACGLLGTLCICSCMIIVILHGHFKVPPRQNSVRPQTLGNSESDLQALGNGVMQVGTGGKN